MMREIQDYVAMHPVAIAPHWGPLVDIVDVVADHDDDGIAAVRHFADLWHLGRADQTADHRWYAATAHGVLVKTLLHRGDS